MMLYCAGISDHGLINSENTVLISCRYLGLASTP